MDYEKCIKYDKCTRDGYSCVKPQEPTKPAPNEYKFKEEEIKEGT
jgi:hypothetical protein